LNPKAGIHIRRRGATSSLAPISLRSCDQLSAPVARTDLDDYIRHLEISVGCYDEDARNEYIVGKLAVDQILWAHALVDGVSLFEIYDSDSRVCTRSTRS